MKRRTGSVFALLMGSYIAIIVATLVVLAISLPIFFQSFYIRTQEREFVRQGREIARLVAASIQEGYQDYMSGVLTIADRLVDGQIWIADRTGLVLASTSSDHDGEGLRLTSTEVKAVLRGRVVARSGRVTQFPEPMIFVAVPVQVSKETLGAVLIYSPLAGVSSTVREVRKLTLGAAAIAIILAIFLGIKLSRSLAHPLEEMSVVAKDMAKGKFNTRVRVSGANEVAQLGIAFNNLASELAQTVAILKNEKSRTDSILKSMAEAVIAIDSASRLIRANPSAHSMFAGLPELGQPLEGQVPVFEVFHQVLTSGEMEVRELPVGESTVVLAHFTPIIDDLGIVLGVVGVFQDISQRWRLEQMQREFVANVSHELRTPLTTIQGFTEAISDGVVTEEAEVRRLSSVVVDEAKRLARLVGDLLDLAKMESGYHRLDLAPTPLGALVDRVLSRVTSLAREHNQKLEFGTRLESDVVLAEADRVEQVLMNLVTNAIVHAGVSGRVTINLRDEGEFIACDVCDTGHGIPKAEQAVIWQRFGRGGRSRGNGNGTGLGLAIVKQIVELHGGQVSVMSEPGEGAVFTFTLPKVPQPLV